jgi:hypothetical protein
MSVMSMMILMTVVAHAVLNNSDVCDGHDDCFVCNVHDALILFLRCLYIMMIF